MKAFQLKLLLLVASGTASAAKYSLSIVNGPLISNDLYLDVTLTIRGKLDPSCTNQTDIPILKNDTHHCPNSNIAFYIALKTSSLKASVPVLGLSESSMETLRANTGKYLLLEMANDAGLFENSTDSFSKASSETGEKGISAIAIVALAVACIIFIFGLCYYYCYGTNRDNPESSLGWLPEPSFTRKKTRPVSEMFKNVEQELVAAQKANKERSVSNTTTCNIDGSFNEVESRISISDPPRSLGTVVNIKDSKPVCAEGEWTLKDDVWIPRNDDTLFPPDVPSADESEGTSMRPLSLNSKRKTREFGEVRTFPI